jgi:DNA modification methylase
MCGDSTDAGAVKRLMNGELAQLIWTDPPWNVDIGSSNNPRWKNGANRQILNDNMSTEAFGAFLLAAFKNMREVCVPGAMAYVVMSAQEWGNIMNVLRQLEFHWSSTLIWAKDQLVLSRKDYHTQYEPIWYGWKDGAARLCPLEDRKQSDVWMIDRPKRSDEHPTMKPIELVARSIKNSSRKDDLVIDFFGGSGTTLIAAEQTGRRCNMIELDPKYCDVIRTRWETLTGETAELLSR